jgi:hypothetical protein
VPLSTMKNVLLSLRASPFQLSTHEMSFPDDEFRS